MQDGTATATVAVDPTAPTELLGRHYDEIGVSGGTATLTVTPVAGRPARSRASAFTAESPAGLAFALDAASLKLAGGPGHGSRAERADLRGRSTRSCRAASPSLAVSVPIDVARTARRPPSSLPRWSSSRRRAWIGRTGRGDVADQFLVRHADRILPVAVVRPRAHRHRRRRTPSPCTGSPSGSTPSSCTTPARTRTSSPSGTSTRPTASSSRARRTAARLARRVPRRPGAAPPRRAPALGPRRLPAGRQGRS